jgi:hypothetical protein
MLTDHDIAQLMNKHSLQDGNNDSPWWLTFARAVEQLSIERAAPADRDVALELSWVPLNRRDANWHAHATVQLRAMHAALHAAAKMPRDPLEIEELWDEAHERWNQAKGDHAEVHEIFARLLERAHGIGA